MSDPTEPIRRSRVSDINAQISTEDPNAERARLEAQYGKVWTTQELTNDFEVIGFASPLVVVKRKSDGQKGSLEFQHSPRLYFNWKSHIPNDCGSGGIQIR